MKFFLIFFTLLTFVSCGLSSEEEKARAIDLALTFLSNEECDKALEVLSEFPDSSSPVYLQVLASAHACKSGFKEIDFIGNNLKNLDLDTFQSFFKTLSIMPLSSETQADSSSFESLVKGVNVLLNSTSSAPSQADRETKFGARKAGDMGMQALFLNLVALGKFLNYYGDVTSAGDKTGCFLDYSGAALAIISSMPTGSCTSGTDGKTELDTSNPSGTGRVRVCKGIVLVTNIIDIVANINLPSGEDLAVLSDIKTQFSTLKTFVETNYSTISDMFALTSQSACESYLTSNLSNIEIFYAIIFEMGLL